jgi:uncharacterized protein YcbK (DUF882 family)
MEKRDLEINALATLARELERKEPIDIATRVYDQFAQLENDEEAAVVALATITKLLVENMVYQLRLKGHGNAE